MSERSSTRKYGVRVTNPETGVVCWVDRISVYPCVFFSVTPRPFRFEFAWFLRQMLRRFYPSVTVVGLK